VEPLLIQRPPTGLLDLLGLKAMGQGPVQLNETVTATLADCVDYYLCARRQHLTATTGVAMVANTNYSLATLAVPSGEIWFLYAMSVHTAGPTAAATSVKFRGGYTFTASSTTPIWLTADTEALATDQASASVKFERPLIWMPGAAGIIQTGAVTGIPNALGRMTIDVARLTL
jgi:hypothetical protein